METIKKIEEIIKNDKEMAAKYQAALEATVEKAGEIEAIRAAAAAIGIEITAEEIERTIAAAQELSDDDLSQVAGGVKGECGHERNCGKDYHCWTIYHTNDCDVRDVGCQADWTCAIFLCHMPSDY